MIEEILSFLETQQIAYLSTIDLQGYPHTVPVWFAIDGDDIIFSSAKDRARRKYIQANSRGSATIGGKMDDSAGYLIKGNLTVETDPSHGLMNKVIGRYLKGEALSQFQAMAEQQERIIVRLTPLKVIKVH